MDETYQIAFNMEDLELELSRDYESLRQCMRRDTERMAVPIPVGWCDNVFKIHCSGLDLLTEIGEAMVDRCKRQLSATVGEDLDRHSGWQRCVGDKVFLRYSVAGEATDEDACHAAFQTCSEAQ